MNVGAVDLAILLAYMAGVVFLGMWVGRATRTAADFMVGGRDLPWWVILFSIVATDTSTVTFLSRSTMKKTEPLRIPMQTRASVSA